MSKQTRLGFYLSILLFLISACSIGPKSSVNLEDLDGLYLPSIKQIYPELEAAAKEIDPDTKLQEVVITLFPDQQGVGHVVLARFDYKVDDELIFVKFYQDGSITAELSVLEALNSTITGKNEIHPGINIDKLNFDAYDAFIKLINYAQLNDKQLDKIGCSVLILKKKDLFISDNDYWFLNIKDCNSDFNQKIVLDNYSGEIIKE